MSSRMFPLACRALVPVFFVLLACARLFSNKVSLSTCMQTQVTQAACPTQSEILCGSPADSWYPVPSWSVAVALARPPRMYKGNYTHTPDSCSA